ncbi:hypothetical protein KAM622c_32890 [Klebsiella quasipneumoniae subsp. quasipneumoniae]|nr:hypothetical protein KAM622c_32890 [Klebsiella quasipneumoniae subsp. quasipneumoniae]
MDGAVEPRLAERWENKDNQLWVTEKYCFIEILRLSVEGGITPYVKGKGK